MSIARFPSRMVGSFAVFALLHVLCNCSPATSPADVPSGDAPNESSSDDASTFDGGSDAIADAPSEINSDAQSDTSLDPLVVGTTTGPVHGIAVSNAVRAFLGIPYAAPPIGSLRWRAPTLPAPWTAPFDATRVGPACPQPPDAVTGQPVAYSEDCLSLNVWTPTPVGSPLRPVMLFIHGGSFTGGSGGLRLYDGGAIVARAGVVVVTINYRLGALGWLAHAALEDAAHPAGSAHGSAGNYGLMDQQFAMRWVRDNIAAFGGDPRSVTVFGESAGSISVCAHLASPNADGLYHRAIGESGSCMYIATPLFGGSATQEPAEALGARFAGALNCTSTVLSMQADCLRAVPVADILRAMGTSVTGASGGASWSPIIDGYVLPDSPWRRFLDGRTRRVPYLSGINKDEASAFTTAIPLNDTAQYRAAIAGLMPHHVDQVVAVYPIASYGTPRAAFNAFAGDVLFLCPALAQAAAVAGQVPLTFVYYFTHPTGIGLSTGLGVFHSSELPFVFGNFVAPYSATDDPANTLSNAMIDDWTRFATSGDPNGTGTVQWPAFAPAAATYLELGTSVRTGTNLRAIECSSIATWIAAGP